MLIPKNSIWIYIILLNLILLLNMKSFPQNTVKPVSLLHIKDRLIYFNKDGNPRCKLSTEAMSKCLATQINNDGIDFVLTDTDRKDLRNLGGNKILFEAIDKKTNEYINQLIGRIDENIEVYDGEKKLIYLGKAEKLNEDFCTSSRKALPDSYWRCEYNRARIYYRQEKYELAISKLEEVLKNKYDKKLENTIYSLIYVARYYNKQCYVIREKESEINIKKFGDSYAKDILGRCYVERGNIDDYTQAQILYEKIVLEDSEYILAYINLGKLLIKIAEREPSKAKETYSRAIENYTLALKIVDLKTEISHYKGEIYFYTGQIYYLNKNYLLAIGNFKDAIKSGYKTYEVYFTLGSAYLDNLEYDKAIDIFHKAIKQSYSNRTKYDAKSKLGFSYIKAKYFAEAISIASESIRVFVEKDLPEIKDESANNKTKNDNYKPYIAEVHNPEEFYYILGLTYAEKRNYEQALENYDAAIEMNSKYREVYKSRAMLQEEKCKEEKTAAEVETCREKNVKPNMSTYSELKRK